jgi:outer membrane receptor for ferrienterochelin and colicins
MRGLGIFLVIVHFSLLVHSQNSIKVRVSAEETKLPLEKATVTIPESGRGAVTDSSGIAVLRNLPNGTFKLEISFIGYRRVKQMVRLPYPKDFVEITMEQDEDENSPEVIVSATRTDRSIRNTPTRVEVISGGEIEENILMRPGEIRMMLNETMGIIAQQISPTSNTANIRIQELEGRYTQILRDGLPLYSGLSEGLSLVQVAPLDLKQVEIIKGSASTLYGGGAIAGLINLVSKTPEDKKEISFLANATSTKGLDLSGFYNERFGKTGLTVFASANHGSPYDPSGTGLTAIPKFNRYTIMPRFFLYGKNTSMNIGFGYITENRLGGNINYVNHGEPGYFEQNTTKRFTTELGIIHRFGDQSTLTFKNSFNHFNRGTSIPDYEFKGIQQSSFSELSWNGGNKKSQWVAGINLYTDNFKESSQNPDSARDYQYHTFGIFIQNTWTLSRVISMESGLRVDYTHPYGFVFLPRVFLLGRLTNKLSSRIGGGLGYKVPAIFTEGSEERQYRNILPINQSLIRYEKSVGGTFDIVYRGNIDELKLTIDPLLFYTRINNPLVLQDLPGGLAEFINADGFTDSKGFELTLRLALDRFSLFTGYSYTDAQNHFNGNSSRYPLAPYNMVHLDLVYDIEGKFRLALESYFTGKQELHDGTIGNSYWLFGALVEKTWGHFSLFINSENLNDIRQTKWGPVYTGNVDNPVFKDIYAPLDGITFNGGFKLKW